MASIGTDPRPASPAPLVGRADERAALDAALAGTLAGRGRLVLIGGEAGVGKTALAEALCREGTARGAIVLVGRGYDRTVTPPYGPWIELFAQYRPDGAAPPPPPAFARRGTIGAVASQGELLQQVLDFFTGLAAPGAGGPEGAGCRPVVLLLDDLQWADPASLDLLRFLARQLAALPLLLLGTYRTDELTRRHPLAVLLPLLVRESGAAHLDLAPFTTTALRDLVRARYPLLPADSDRLVGYLADRTEGNALFVLELLRTLEERGALRPGERWHLGGLDHLAVPPLLTQVIEGRLARLGEEAVRLLRVAAVIGQAVPLAVWAAASGADDETLLAVGEAAEEARILGEVPDGDGVRFTHALVREALYEGFASIRRRRLHRQVGEILAVQRHPDPDAVAHHLQQGHDPGAYTWLVRAGERAEAAYAWATAVERFAAAENLLAGDADRRGERAWLLFDLARLLRFADGPRAIGYCEEATRLAAALRDGTLAAHIRFMHGWLVGNAGDFARAIALIERAVAILQALPPEERGRDIVVRGTFALSAAHWRESLCMWYTGAGRYREARALGESLLANADAGLEVQAALSRAYAALGLPEAARELSRQHLALERARGHLPSIAFALLQDLTRIHLPYYADDAAGRRRIAGEAAEAWRRSSGALGDFDPAIATFPVLALEGEWVQADRVWPTARGLPREGYARQLYSNNLLASWLTLRVARGEVDDAWTVLRAVLPDGVTAPPGATSYTASTAVLRGAAALTLAGGDLDTARSWLEAHDRWLAWSEALPNRAEGQALWAQYHRQAGDPAQARACAERALAHATEPRQPLALLAAHRLLGELATEARRFADAQDHLEAALALAEACAAPYERALTLLALAELRAASGARDAAQAPLDEARAICAPLGARPALARAAALAARLALVKPPPAAYPAGLTAREVEVLRLVAAGRSNRQIAAALSVSTRTIERHLENIYGKIDAHSKAETIAYAFRHNLT